MHLFAVISHVPLTSVFLTAGIQIQSWAEIQVWQKFLLYSAMYFHQEARRQMFTGNTKSHQETQTVKSYTGFKQKVKLFPEPRWWDSHRESSSNGGLWTTGRPAVMPGLGKRTRVHSGDAVEVSQEKRGLVCEGVPAKESLGSAAAAWGLGDEAGRGVRVTVWHILLWRETVPEGSREHSWDVGWESCRVRWLRVWPLRWSTASAHRQLQVYILNVLNDLEVFTSPTFLTFLFWSRCTSL